MEMVKPKCSAQIFLAFLIITGFFLALWWVLSHDIPDKNHDAVVYLLGVLSGMILAVIGFFFGSSAAGNSAQQQQLAPHPALPQNQQSTASVAADMGMSPAQTAPQTVNVSVSAASATPGA